MKHPESPYKQGNDLDPIWVQAFKILGVIGVTALTALFLLILIAKA